MPRKCCVPECRGNYDESTKVSVFSFPADSERKRLWLSKIPRADFQPTKQSVVCVEHFCEQFVVRYDSATRPDGSVLTVKRTNPKLTDDAYPSIFPRCPSYLSEEPPTKRRNPEERRTEAERRDESEFEAYMDKDKIKDFEHFNQEFSSHCDPEVWKYKLYENSGGTQTYWSLLQVRDDDIDTLPKLLCVVRVFADMHVEVFTDKGIGIGKCL